MKTTISRKIALRAILIALAFILSWIEAQIPVFFTVPGIKLGLSNLVVLIALYKLSATDAFLINIVRIILTGFTFGSLVTISYSIAGGLLSFIVMYVLKNFLRSGINFVSIFGGISHNMGQLIIASILLQNLHTFYLLPYLWVSGILTGLAIGLICGLILKRIDKYPI